MALGDVVVSYDRQGRLRPGRVSRTFVNEVRQVLDVHGLMVTPGHVTLCGDGPFAGRHVPMMDILRSDGALMMEDGSLVRAATGCAVGSEGDRWVVAIVGERQADGTVEVAEVGRIRAGTRAITAEGEDVGVLDLIRAAGATLGEDGLIRTAEGGAGVPFRWTLTPSLPKPEDYVLQRSATTLGDVYAAGEWEGVAPRMTAPAPSAAVPRGRGPDERAGRTRERAAGAAGRPAGSSLQSPAAARGAGQGAEDGARGMPGGAALRASRAGVRRRLGPPFARCTSEERHAGTVRPFRTGCFRVCGDGPEARSRAQGNISIAPQ